jgi:hypothetical protein
LRNFIASDKCHEAVYFNVLRGTEEKFSWDIIPYAVSITPDTYAGGYQRGSH